MSRYIDADRLIAHLKDEIEECDPKCGGRPDIAYGVTLGLKYAIAFAEALSADVVEVVRCKDCKHYREESFHCWLMRGKMSLNDYCSYGERRG